MASASGEALCEFRDRHSDFRRRRTRVTQPQPGRVISAAGCSRRDRHAILETIREQTLDAALVEDFLYALCTHAGLDLHVERLYGHNVHHIVEGIFKGLGRALDQATRVDPRIRGPLSTKGSL